MATELVITKLTRTGHSVGSKTAFAAAGMYFSNPWGEKVFLVITSTHSSPQTLTITQYPGQTLDGVTPANKTVTLPATDTIVVGPFLQSKYNDSSNYVQLAAATFTGVSLLGFKLIDE
jgi:hypothetical protein